MWKGERSAALWKKMWKNSAIHRRVRNESTAAKTKNVHSNIK